MDNQKTLKKTALFALMWIIVAIVVLASSTYAWFSSNTRVRTNSMTVGSRRFNDMILELSHEGGNAFKNEENITLRQVNEHDMMSLMPVSTSDLKKFVTCTDINPDNKTSDFAVLDGEYLFYHATFYLRVKSDYPEDYNKTVGLYIEGLPFELAEKVNENGNILGALRLGLLIDDSQSMIYRQTPTAQQDANAYFGGELIPPQKVISAIGDEFVLLDDPATMIGNYTADWTTDDVEETFFMDTTPNEIHKVDVFIYLEGCDPECVAEIQLSEFDFSLNFYGVRK